MDYDNDRWGTLTKEKPIGHYSVPHKSFKKGQIFAVNFTDLVIVRLVLLVYHRK